MNPEPLYVIVHPDGYRTPPRPWKYVLRELSRRKYVCGLGYRIGFVPRQEPPASTPLTARRRADRVRTTKG